MKRKRMMIAFVVLLLALTGTAAYAIPVEDLSLYVLLKALQTQSETSKALQAGKQLAQMIEEVKQAKEMVTRFADYQSYLKIINGKWQEMIPGLKNTQSSGTLADLNVDLNNLGWDMTQFYKVSSTNSAAKSLDELRQVLDAKAGSDGLAKMRDAVEGIYGDVPVTRNGVPVEAAYREIATVSAATGEMSKAIDEKRENIAAMKEEINSGNLAPGDLERMMTLIASEEADISMLQTKAINNSNRLAVQQLGLQAGAVGGAERSRLKDRQTRVEMLGGIYFSPELSTTPQGAD